jgi:hypothetical protein
MSTIDRALDLFPDTRREDWRDVGGAAVHCDATIGGRAVFCGPAIVRRGWFHGGEFHGGWFRGGEFHGGRFHGGEFHGGRFDATPPQVFGVVPWRVNVASPNEIVVGYQCHTVEHWRENLNLIAARHNVDDATRERVRNVIELLAADRSRWPQPIGQTTTACPAR